MAVSPEQFVRESLTGYRACVISPIDARKGIDHVTCPDCGTQISLRSSRGQPAPRILGVAIIEVWCTNRQCVRYDRDGEPMRVLVSS